MQLLKKTIRGVPVFPFLLLLLFYTWQTWLVKGNGFFWDTVQFGSLHAHWYYENHFRFFFLPDELDSGHSPVFGMYIAVFWRCFGKSLAISHFAMLPWLILAIWQMLLLAKKMTADHWLQLLFVLVLIADPVWSAQSTLVSPDLVLGACFLGALNAILSGRKWLVCLFVLALSLVSNRGLLVSGVLFTAAYLYKNSLKINIQNIFRTIGPFLPGWLMAISYLAAHYLQKGWIGYYEGSSWNESFVSVNGSELVKNIVVYGWRLTDFGHLFIWLIIAYLILTNGRQLRFFKDKETGMVAFLGIGLLVLFAITVIPYRGLMGHRYFLPIYWSSGILLLFLLKQLSEKVAKRWLSIAIMALLLGNCWVYPQPVATGWDSTLAHLSYYPLRTKMMAYMQEKGIPFEITGTAFPNQLSTKYIDLTTKDYRFAQKDLQQNQYVFYSNVMNDFSAAELDTLNSSWTKVRTFKQGFVEVILFKK